MSRTLSTFIVYSIKSHSEHGALVGQDWNDRVDLGTAFIIMSRGLRGMDGLGVDMEC